MQKTQPCLFIIKICLSVGILLCLLSLLSFNAVAQTTINQTIQTNRLAKIQLGFLGSDNLWPLKKDTWLFKDYGLYQGTLWTGNETRQISEQVAFGNNNVLDDLKYLRVRSIVGLKKQLINIAEVDKIKLENLPKLREQYFFTNYQSNIWETIPSLPKLEALDLSYNKISDMQKLGMLDMPTLQYLDLHGNSISRAEMSAEQWPQLRELILRGNGIDEITLENFPSLEALDLSYNKILSLLYSSVEGQRKSIILDMPTLQYLDLSYNDIRYAKIPDNLSQLKELILNHNKIITIALDNLPMLESLDLSNNKTITSIHGLENLTALKKLDISDTHITSLTGLEGLVNLEELRADYLERLQTFDGLGNLPNLRFLHINEPKNHYITGLDGLPNLRELYLGGKFAKLEGLDNLQKLEKLIVRSYGGVPLKIEGLDNLKELRELNLSGSFVKIQGLDNLAQLEKLSISSILLQRIGGLDKLANLKSLKLSGCNDISQIENLDTLVNLKELALPGCNITNISDMGNLPHPEILETLDLTGNNIKTFDNAPLMPNLTTLNLTATGLTSFNNVQPLPNLKNLSLRNKFLGDNLAGLQGCPNLETLDLSTTSISNIQHLAGLAKLQELNLSQNTLKSLDGLETLVSLQWLDLHESQIDTIKRVPSSLRYLRLERSTITNLDFLANAKDLLNLQVLLAADSRIRGIADFSHAHNLKYIDLSNCQLTGITGFEYLPFDAYLILLRNSLPLSQIYPLMQDVSYRIWEIGHFQYNVLFETLELKLSQPLDLSSEKEFGGIPTTYIVTRKYVENNQTKWERATQDSAYIINDGVISFLETGEYCISMINKAVVQYPQDYDFKPYPIEVRTGIISVF